MADQLSKSGIYKITNNVNGKIYIGCATNILIRWYRHTTDANNQRHHSITFQRAWNKYGSENFEISILEYVENLNCLEEREQFYLDSLKSYDSSIGYNICKSGTVQLGMKRSEEARENMRQGQLGKSHSEETIEKMRASRRDFDKWPCAKASKCNCNRCKQVKRNYIRDKRQNAASKEGRVIFSRNRIQNY